MEGLEGIIHTLLLYLSYLLKIQNPRDFWHLAKNTFNNITASRFLLFNLTAPLPFYIFLKLKSSLRPLLKSFPYFHSNLQVNITHLENVWIVQVRYK